MAKVNLFRIKQHFLSFSQSVVLSPFAFIVIRVLFLLGKWCTVCGGCLDFCGWQSVLLLRAMLRTEKKLRRAERLQNKVVKGQLQKMLKASFLLSLLLFATEAEADGKGNFLSHNLAPPMACRAFEMAEGTFHLLCSVILLPIS